MAEVMTHRTVCTICSARCGILAETKAGLLVSASPDPTHALNGGAICPKGRALPDILSAPVRLRSPHVRESGALVETTWDVALDRVADDVRRVSETYGVDSIALHVGQAGIGQGFLPYVRLLANAIGTPNYSSAGSHCHVAKEMANEHTYGFLPEPDYLRSECIVLWGYNPAESSATVMARVSSVRKRGARLIVIDPRTTTTARSADIHLAPRPGTDGALALGMINVIATEHLYDDVFVRDWTVGFDQLVERAAGFDPQRVEVITGVEARLIIQAARTYAGSRPAALYQGIAVELQTNGYHGIRAMAALQAITGNLEVAGGALKVPMPPLGPVGTTPQVQSEAIGEKEFALFGLQPHGSAQANRYGRAVLEGAPYPLRMLLVHGANPLLTWPGANRLREALGRLESLVVVDQVLTETAKLASVVLPAASFLARPELWYGMDADGGLRIGVSQPVLEEPGLMTDWQIVRAIAIRLGLEKHFPWANETEALDERLQPMGLSVERLAASPRGVEWGSVEYETYIPSGFRTPSGKVELASATLGEAGYDPLPAYTPITQGEGFANEVIVTTGARVAAYQHSRYRWVDTLRRQEPEPRAHMHPDTATLAGIVDGAHVAVTTAFGQVTMKAKVAEGIVPGAVSMPHGWDEANANELTDPEVLDGVTGFPGDRAFTASISPVPAQAPYRSISTNASMRTLS